MDGFWLKQIVETVVWGGVTLVGVTALGMRFALKPVWEARARALQARNVPEAMQRQEDRIHQLEAELEDMQRQVAALAEAEAFHRRLESGAAAALPV